MMTVISSIPIFGKMLNTLRCNLIFLKAEVYSILGYGAWGLGDWNPFYDSNLIIRLLTTHLENKQQHIKQSHEVHNEWSVVIGVINVTLFCQLLKAQWRDVREAWRDFTDL